MAETEDNETNEAESHPLRDGLSGLGQKIIGEIETIGGILTGDPNTQAEGEFNIEVGDLREEVEDDLEGSDADQSGDGHNEDPE